MRIEHVAVYVRDLEHGVAFYERYFDAQRGELYVNSRTGFSSYFLSFDEGARLEVMHNDAIDGEVNRENRGYAHVAFSVGSEESADELTARMRADGYEVISGPRVTGDGYCESCMLDGEGNAVEITV